jgi:hypothetical protein
MVYRGLMVFLATMTAILATVLGTGTAFAQQKQLVTQGEAAPEAGKTPVTARQAAIDDALRAAVEQGVGFILTSETVTKNYELLSDQIFKKAAGFARLDKVNKESATNSGTYSVEITATVSSAAIMDGLRKTLKQFNDPRVAIFVDESIDGNTRQSPASTAIAKYFIDLGYRVLDKTQVEKNAQRDELFAASQNPAAAAAIAQRLKVDFLVTGVLEAKSESLSSATGGLLGGILSNAVKTQEAILEIKLIDALSGQIAFSDRFSSKFPPVPTAPGPIDTVVSNALKPLQQRFSSWIQSALDNVATIVYVVKVSGFDFLGFDEFVQKLKTQAGVTGVQSRDFDAAGTNIEVTFGGNTTELARLVSRLGVTVTGVTGREITGRVGK